MYTSFKRAAGTGALLGAAALGLIQEAEPPCATPECQKVGSVEAIKLYAMPDDHQDQSNNAPMRMVVAAVTTSVNSNIPKWGDLQGIRYLQSLK